jgi:putative phage-type endonuclease
MSSSLISKSPKIILEELKQKPLIKQRTPEWFKLREDRLTASDLYDAIKNPLSLAKKKIKAISYNSNAIPALKWGTMFEPMATRIYSIMNNKQVFEFGLIINDNIPNFGASPDGITEDGVMIEIKCPYKRKIIDGEIPEKYYYQIQGQLAVCQLFNCDYIECEFECYNNEYDYLSNTNNLENYKHGIIAENKIDYSYIYSKEKQSALENINEMNSYLNDNNYRLNYWSLKLINIQKVEYNSNKWDNEILPKINNFYNIYINEKKNKEKPIDLFILDDD